MFEIDLNFDDVEAAVPYEPVPAGKYTLMIESAKINPAKDATPEQIADDKVPSPQLEIGFVIEDQDNKKIRHWITLSAKARPFFLQFLQAIYSAETFPARISLQSEEDALEFCADLIGMTCNADVDKTKRRDNPGKFQNSIGSFIPA